MDDTTVPTGDAVARDSSRPRRLDDRAARVAALAASLRDERLEVLPFYHDLRNQIVRPLNLHVETRYFFRKWKSELGPVLTLLIMELRDRCYYNPRTGERRDYCWPSQEELARAIGVSVRTVIRALQDPLAGKFIRVQHRYRYDVTMGKKVRTSSAYVVSMDDPLRAEDEAVLTRMVAEQILAEETARRDQLLVSQTEDTLPSAAGHPPGATDRSPSAKRAPNPRPDQGHRRRLDLHADLAARSSGDLTDKMAPTSSTSLTANLSPIAMGDKLAEEEIPGRDPSKENEDWSGHGSSLLGRVIQTYADANDRPPTPLERQRLADLVTRFDPPARAAHPPSTGVEWVRSAIVEAVDSGSAFVAPRRIATICERWARGARPAAAPRDPGRGKRRRDAGGGTPPTPESTSLPDPDEVGAAEPPADRFEEPVGVVVPTFVVSAGRPIANWQLWRLVTDELADRPIAERNRRWLDQAAIIGEADGALIVGAPSGFARDLLERRFGDAMARVIASALGESRPVRFVVSRDWLEGRPTEDGTVVRGEQGD